MNHATTATAGQPFVIQLSGSRLSHVDAMAVINADTGASLPWAFKAQLSTGLITIEVPLSARGAFCFRCGPRSSEPIKTDGSSFTAQL